MRKTKQNENERPDVLMVDRAGLQAVCGCGRGSAERIAKAAGASVWIGRRHLYNVQKIKDFLNSVSE